MTRRSRRPRSRGQTLVEFTLILPVALLMTVGIIDFARLFAAHISLTNGVREGALYAGSGGYVDPVGIRNRIEAEASGMDPLLITMDDPECDPAPCSVDSLTVTINATYPFQPLMPIIYLITGNPTMLQATTTSQIRWIP